ncbi:MAG: hypothetical protein UT65_C0008G0001, partial [Parcubacteria group bacterium GW2011_GWF2_39_8b]
MIALENLYQPDKYKVLLGNGKSCGFCTVWNETEKAIKECPELLERSAIIGTLYSRQGVNIIFKLWKNGINENREIAETDFKIEKEIDIEVVNQIIKNVTLKVMSDADLTVVLKEVTETNDGPYMEPVRFADAIPEVVDVFPSEKVGFIVRGKTGLEAW